MKHRTRRKVLIALAAAGYLLFTAIVIFAFAWSAVGNYLVSLTTPLGWDREEKREGTRSYYTSSFSDKAGASAYARETALDAQEEGTVLLENDGALPLSESERKVSVFGSGSVNLVYGGTGSGEGNGGTKNVDLYSALRAEGFSVNPVLEKFYLEKSRAGYRRGKGTDMNGGYLGKQGARDYGYSVNEVERAQYSSALRSSYGEYSDAAIVVISRSGGEGQDLPTSMRAFYEGDERHYLELTQEEEELLEEVSSGGFQKVILLLNTLNPFEADFLKQTDAALWIGGPGQYGMTAVAQMLTGKRSPSGRLPDTFARDLLSSPAMQNYGDNRYTEKGAVTTAAYVAYAEGIYIGYRYYETRYFDAAMGHKGAGEFDYEKEVVYPFGYGLNYTTFTRSEPKLEEEGEEFVLSVTVKNTGTRKGKETVQLYLQKPYTEYDRENGVEKAAAELVGYAKTRSLSPGESERVEIRVKRNALASYDVHGAGTYLAEAGDYLFCFADNAHAAAETFLGGEGLTLPLLRELFEKSGTGYPIVNRFETEEYSSLPGDVALLSRDDWTGTFPKPYGRGEAGAATYEMTPEIKEEILNQDEKAHLGRNTDETDYLYSAKTGETRVEIGEAVTDSGAGLKFIDAVEADGFVRDYDDVFWAQLVKCMTKAELYRLLSSGFGQSPEILSIDKPKSITSDSPMGLHSGTLFPCYPIQAATFDAEIAERVGDAIAEEAIWEDIRGWYAPACNTHRFPFGGRNYEYYSEDGTLAGKYAASVVRSTQAGGLFVHLKHFALNDQDTNRGDRGNFKNGDPYNGLCTYAGEQAIREIYLRPFQFAVEEGGAHGVMTSYNRIGNTWSGGHHGLVTEVLRNEWGMQGIALTDYAGTFGYVYMNMNQGLRAGNSQWLHPSDAFPIDDKTSNAALYYMQKAAKDILFAEAHSSRVNNLRYEDGSAVELTFRLPTWKGIVLAVYLPMTVGMLLLVLLRRNPNKKPRGDGNAARR